MWGILINKEAIIMRKELLQGLSEEQIKKVEACKDTSEILALAKAEGIELTDQQLEAVTGGACAGGGTTCRCPNCGSKNIKHKVKHVNNAEIHSWICQDCGASC